MTTVSIGAHHTTSKEPDRLTVVADPGTALGVSFGKGGIVCQVWCAFWDVTKYIIIVSIVGMLE